MFTHRGEVTACWGHRSADVCVAAVAIGDGLLPGSRSPPHCSYRVDGDRSGSMASCGGTADVACGHGGQVRPNVLCLFLRTVNPDPERTPMAPGMQLESSRSTTEFSGAIGRPLNHWVGFNQLVRRCLATIRESGLGLLDTDSHLIYSTTCHPARVESRPPEPKAIQPKPPSLQPVP